MGGGRSAPPVVHVVENQLEPAAGKGLGDGRGVVAVTANFSRSTGKGIPLAAMQNRDFVAAVQKQPHQRPADKKSPADDQRAAHSTMLTEPRPRLEMPLQKNYLRSICKYC